MHELEVDGKLQNVVGFFFLSFFFFFSSKKGRHKEEGS